MEPVFLGLDEVIEIHSNQIARYGGSPGIRDIELLQSAIAIPAAGCGGDYLHADICEMTAAYLFHIIRNHPFVDGNKRTGAVAALVFLIMNGFQLHASEDSFEAMVRSVAEGKMDKATDFLGCLYRLILTLILIRCAVLIRNGIIFGFIPK